MRGVPLSTRAHAFAEDLERAELPPRCEAHAVDRWERGLAARAWTAERICCCTVTRTRENVVVDDAAEGNRVVAALIDWGDTTAGDPASDLGALLLHGLGAAPLETYRASAELGGHRGRRDLGPARRSRPRLGDAHGVEPDRGVTRRTIPWGRSLDGCFEAADARPGPARPDVTVTRVPEEGVQIVSVASARGPGSTAACHSARFLPGGMALMPYQRVRISSHYCSAAPIGEIDS